MKIEFEGLTELNLGLLSRAQMDAVKHVVKYDGADMQKRMQQNAIFKKGYSKGDTQKSISLELTDGGLSASVGPGTEYSPYLEYGTRYMEAQPFVRPTFNVVKVQFINHMRQLFK